MKHWASIYPVRSVLSISLLCIGLLLGCNNTTKQKSGTLITHTTLINPGTHIEVIKDAYVYFSGNRIISYGAMGKTPLPEAAQLIDATGKYTMPGLIDGFATLNNQAYANAYLYKGITTILEVDGGRRGTYFVDATPAPDVYRLEGIAEAPMPTEKLEPTIDSLYNAGVKVLLMMYGLTPEQTKLVNDYAHSLGMATIGEMATTTYAQGMDIGLDAFVHTTRYSLDVAPRQMAEAVAKEPFSNDLNSAKWQYYKYLTRIKADNSALLAHAKRLGASNTFIIPTMSLSYLDLPEAKNPWNDPVAQILTPEDINRPADKITGKHSIDAVEQAAYTNLIKTETEIIEPAYYKAGAKYLAGSGTDVWGTMPGISLHTELQLLHTKPGLTNEEVLAAATVNFNKAFGWNVGQLKPGFEADILILDKNPLENLDNLTAIHTLIVNGKAIDYTRLLSTKTNDKE